MKVTAFVPIKLNSERLPFKNIKPFDNGEPLISYILKTLLKVEGIDEIYVFCSDESIKPYLPDGIKFLQRDKVLDLSATKFIEVLKSFAHAVDSEVYVLTHATAPFMSRESIRNGVNAVVYDGHDSAFSVSKINDFLWVNNKPFNYSLDNIPRTQDLPDIFAETCGLYVYTKDLILQKGRRIGDNAKLIEVSKVEACDINTADDFVIANAIYNSSFKEIQDG